MGRTCKHAFSKVHCWIRPFAGPKENRGTTSMEQTISQATSRILVAEDHPSLARSIAEGLREEGYTVDLTLDGMEADRLLSTHRYDCVALDLILPGKDGFTILREMRQRGNRTPVLCVTARDALDDRVQGLN